MKQSINFCQFTDAFNDHGRGDNFSYEGLKALYEWIEQLDDECGTETELDVVALWCEFTEYEDLEEFQGNYDADEYPDWGAISERTTLIPIEQGTDGFIIQDF